MPAAKIKLISSDWRYCDVEVAALVVASVGGEVGGVELAAMMTVLVEEAVFP